MASHAQLPVAEPVDESRVRIYFGTRDSRNRSRPTFLEASANFTQPGEETPVAATYDLDGRALMILIAR